MASAVSHPGAVSSQAISAVQSKQYGKAYYRYALARQISASSHLMPTVVDVLAAGALGSPVVHCCRVRLVPHEPAGHDAAAARLAAVWHLALRHLCGPPHMRIRGWVCTGAIFSRAIGSEVCSIPAAPAS